MTNRKPIDESTLLEEVRRYLKALRCTTMAGELANMLGAPTYGSMSHLQWVHHLVKTEVNQRTYTRTIRYLRESGIGLGDPSDLDRIRNPSKRGIDTSVLGSFKTGEWLEGSYVPGVLITGATGTGKTFLVKGICKITCMKGYRTRYLRMPLFLEELRRADEHNQMAEYRSRLNNFKVLAIDDWGMAPMDDRQRSDFLSILDERIGKSGMIIASQLEIDQWYAYIKDAFHADAIMDRLTHGSHLMELKGESMRKLTAPKLKKHK